MQGEYYLAHPFDSRKKIREWELDFENRTGIQLINPFYDIEREDIKLIDKGIRSKGESDPTLLVERDLEMIRNATKGMVVIILDAKSYGTIQEIVYAKKIYKKEVHIVVLNGEHRHPWLRYHSDNIFTSLSDLENYFKRKK